MLGQILRPLAAVVPVLAALIRRTDRRLTDRLKAASALDAARAVAIETPSALEDWRLRRMLRGGAVRRAPGGLWFLDEAGMAAYRRGRRARALSVVAVVIAATIVIYLVS